MQIKHPHGALGQIAHGCCSNGALQRAGGRFPPSTTARLLQELKGHVHLIAQLEPGPKQIHPGQGGKPAAKPKNKNKMHTADRVKVPDSPQGYSGMNENNLRICYSYNRPHGCSNGTHEKDGRACRAKDAMSASNVEADIPMQTCNK
jgi:hypothetical protein